MEIAFWIWFSGFLVALIISICDYLFYCELEKQMFTVWQYVKISLWSWFVIAIVIAGCIYSWREK